MKMKTPETGFHRSRVRILNIGISFFFLLFAHGIGFANGGFRSPCADLPLDLNFNEGASSHLVHFLTVTSEKKDLGARCFFARVKESKSGKTFDGLEIYNTVGLPPSSFNFQEIAKGVVILPRQEEVEMGEIAQSVLQGRDLDPRSGGRLTLTILRNGWKLKTGIGDGDYRVFEMYAEFDPITGSVQLSEMNVGKSFNRMHFFLNRILFGTKVAGIDGFTLRQEDETDFFPHLPKDTSEFHRPEEIVFVRADDLEKIKVPEYALKSSMVLKDY